MEKALREKYIYMFITAVLVGVITFSITYSAIKINQPQQLNCSQQGYISSAEVNQLVNISNMLVDVSNAYYAQYNLTALPHIKYYVNGTQN